MSQPSIAMNKPIPWTVLSGTMGNVSPPGDPPSQGVLLSSSSGVDVVPNWYRITINFETRTPKPWPGGKPGNKAWNPYSYSKRVWGESYVNATIWQSGPPFPGQLRFRTDTGQFSRVFTGISIAADQPQPPTGLAAQRLLTKIKAMDWNAGEMLGEVHQTASLVKTTMDRIANAILAVKSGNTRKAMKILNVASKRALGPAQKRLIARKLRTKRERQIASEWLAINYGVIPLIDDVQSAVKHLQNRSDWSVYAHSSASETPVYRRSGLCSTTQGYGQAKYVSSVDWKVTARYAVQFVADSPAIAYYRSLGLTNMPSLAWELYPGSLLVDWLIPIGSWLSNMDAAFGCTFLRGVLVQKTTANTDVSAWLSSTPGVDASGAGRMKYTDTVYNRTVLTSFPTNSFPQFKNPASVGHAANALAFLVQAVHR